uniref:Uncharacterized protein n=1 Tax=Ralstonia solanacearum TaxID=305 RepID=A0A0S4TUV2_RALSL|nr:protein of unknown function [Ralstonia solanacearum]
MQWADLFRVKDCWPLRSGHCCG